MVILGHDGVGEREAVVVASAAADGVTLEETEARGGLAGIDDAGFCPFRFSDIGGSQGGDAGEALCEVEGDAFGLQDGAGGAVDGGKHCACGEGLPVRDVEFGGDGGVGEGEGGSNQVFATEDSRFAGDKVSGDRGGRGDEGLRG